MRGYPLIRRRLSISGETPLSLSPATRTMNDSLDQLTARRKLEKNRRKYPAGIVRGKHDHRVCGSNQ